VDVTGHYTGMADDERRHLRPAGKRGKLQWLGTYELDWLFRASDNKSCLNRQERQGTQRNAWTHFYITWRSWQFDDQVKIKKPELRPLDRMLPSAQCYGDSRDGVLDLMRSRLLRLPG